jgi:hypothetical protein
VLHAQLALLGDGCVAAAVTALKAAAGDGDFAVATVPILSDETQNHAQMSLVDGSAYGRPDSARYRNVSAPVRSIDGVLEEYGRVLGCVEINQWNGRVQQNFKPLHLGQIEVDSADFWTNRLLSSSFRSTAESLASKRSHTRTLKSG